MGINHTVQSRWTLFPPVSDEIKTALDGFHPTFIQILANRKVTTRSAADAFLRAEPPHDTSPEQLSNIQEAIDRIRWAVNQGEPIAVYGDYDVDGVSATALLVQFLESIGAKVTGYIPNRFEEGYGVNKETLAGLANEGVRLIITVDCGIRSWPEADYAYELGLDLIITDHHQPLELLPRARAIINPKQAGDGYPEKELSGVGIAYKLIQALAKVENGAKPEQFLDLVALGTVADLVPLLGENRFLVRHGIERLRQTRRPGLYSLIATARLDPLRIKSSDIGHVIGPRLNAAGRLESALASLRLLTTKDQSEAGELAQKLDNHNHTRQDLTRQHEELARQLIFREEDNPDLLVAIHPEFNQGIVGLVASHLIEKFYRPAIVGSQGPETTRASCRSIPEFHITEALDQCAELMEHHGGHAAAAGFTVKNAKLPELLDRLKLIAKETLAGKDLHPTIKADIELDLSRRIDFFDQLELLEPTGERNHQAIFISHGLEPTQVKTVGRDANHLRFRVANGWPCIAFRQGHWIDAMPAKVDLLYNIESSEYNGQSYLQLNVRDIRDSRL